MQVLLIFTNDFVFFVKPLTFFKMLKNYIKNKYTLKLIFKISYQISKNLQKEKK